MSWPGCARAPVVPGHCLRRRSGANGWGPAGVRQRAGRDRAGPGCVRPGGAAGAAGRWPGHGLDGLRQAAAIDLSQTAGRPFHPVVALPEERMEPREIDEGRLRWQRRYDAARKRDADFATLSGVAVEPVYGPPAGTAVPGFERIGWPGEYPFTRGLYPAGYRGRT